MSSAYTTTLPKPPKLPPHLTARVVVMRADGADMTDADFAAAEACFPAAGEDAGAIGNAKPEGKAKAHAGTKARKPAPKRAAAKRPASR